MHQQQLLATRIVAATVYDGLMEYNPLKQDEIIPDLAERFDLSPDGLAYTFRLNKGIKFHNGSQMTSEDVRFSLERIINPPRGVRSPRRELLLSVDRIETPDPDTVRIVTKYPDASFMGGIALSHHVIYPKKVVEQKGDMKQTMDGTGPFKLERYTAGSVLEMVKHRDYFRKGRPYLDGLKFYIITDAATRFAAFRTGRVLLTSPGSGGLNPTQVGITNRELKGKAHAVEYTQLSNALVQMNVSRKPIGDVRVRKALNLLADRPALIKAYGEGSGVLSLYFAPEPWGSFEFPNAEMLQTPGYRPDKSSDVAEAKQFLAEAGFEKGLSLTMTIRTLEVDVRMSTAYKEMVKAAGIDLKLEVLDAGTFTSRKAKEDYEILQEAWGVHADDPTAWLANVLPPVISFKDGTLDNWVKQQSRLLDVAERKKLVRQIELRLLELMPTMPSWRSGKNASGVWDNVKNFGTPIGIWNCNKYTEVWLAT